MKSPQAQAQAKFLEGWAYHQKGRVREAWAIYQDALKIHPGNFNALHMAGIIAAQSRDFAVAGDLFGRAVAADPSNADAHFNLGNLLKDFKKTAAAVANFDKAIQLRPSFPEAHNNRGNALKDLKEFEAAVASYDKAIVLKPGYIHALFNRGRALMALKRYQAALESFDKAIRINPSLAEAWHGSGQARAELRQFQAAIEHFDNAIRLKPAYGEAHNSRGAALMELKKHDAALAAFGAAISQKNDFVEPYINRANVLAELKRHTEAITDYDRALTLDPSQVSLHGARLHAKMNICDWRDYDRDIAAVLEKVMRGEKTAAPFQCITFTDQPDIQRKAAETWAGDFPHHPASIKLSRREKIRVGYFSMDFRQHPVATLVAGLIENHNRDRFEVYGFSYGPNTGDAMRKRLERSFDKFIDVRDQSDANVAALARQMEIDIAIDLGGFTNSARTGIFAEQAAPIQVNYLGYPGTMGVAYYDYIIADKTLVPEDSRQHYAERVVHLPGCYQPNDQSRKISDRVFSREELGLPKDGFVFCCFNNNFKITPSVFDAWMRILKQIDGSVMWLLEDTATAAKNLRSEAERRGIASKRLIFTDRAPQDEHLARHSIADLFLDTSPYNAHTSASDALWTGLPLLTCIGRSFSSRVAASILNRLDLTELITTSIQEYEDRAIALARDPEMLGGLKMRVMENRFTAPLFNASIYAHGIEDAYSLMAARHYAGQPLGDIRGL